MLLTRLKLLIYWMIIVSNSGTLVSFVKADYPLPPDPSQLPIPAQAYMSGSTAMLTQRALQLTPTIFHKFIDDAITFIQNYPLNDEGHHSGCCSQDNDDKHKKNLSITTREDWLIRLSTASKSIQLLNDPILTIVDDNHIQIDGTLHVSMISQVHFTEYVCCLEWFFNWCCASDTLCDNSQVWVDMILHIQINIEVDNTNTGVVFTPVVTLSYPGEVKYGGCKCDIFCAIVAKFWDIGTGDIITKAQSFIQDQVNREMKSISAGSIYSPYYGIAIRYIITSAILRTNEDIRAYISIVVYALELDTQQWLIYEDPDPERNLLYPPFDWPSPGLILPLACLRVGTNVMNAIAWASERIGTFQSNGNDIISDVFLNEDLHWRDLKISIPYGQDQALIHIEYASINVTCQFNRFNCSNSTLDTNSSSCIIPDSEIEKYAVPFLVGSITNIEINSTMLMTVVNFRPGVYLQTTAVDSETLNITIERLPLPLPPSVEQSLMKHILGRSVSFINPILLKHPLLLPLEIVPYFPNPSSHLFAQNNSHFQNVGYGYIDIASNEVVHFSATKYDTQSNYNKTIQTNPAQQFDHIDKTLFVDDIRSTYSSGVYLLVYESEYNNIQNTNCSIAQPGLHMSLYTLLTTSYLNSMLIMNHHDSTLNNISAQCMNTSAFSSNLAYCSLLQDSFTGMILAISFMCSDSTCEQCQFQQEFSMDMKQNPVYTQECLTGKYVYNYNRTFSLRMTLWMSDDDHNDKLKTCTINTNTIIPQLDFNLIKSNHMFLLTYPNVDSSMLQCSWNNMNIDNNTGTYLMNIMNLGSNMVSIANSLPSLLLNQSHPQEYCSKCENSLSLSSMSCSAAQIRDYPNCYTFEAFCISNCSDCDLNTVELARLACLNTCSFTNTIINTTLVGTSILSVEELWNSNCCLNTPCTTSKSFGKLTGIIVGCIICFVILIVLLVIYFRKKRTDQIVAATLDDERRPLLDHEQVEHRCKLQMNFQLKQFLYRQMYQLREWFFQTFQRPSTHETSPINIISMTCSLFNLILLSYLCYTWINASPFKFVLDSSIDEERYGLSDKYIDNTKAKYDFTSWQNAGKWITMISIPLVLFPFLHFFVQNEKKKQFQTFIQYILIFILFLHISILLIPTFLYVFSDSMIIRPSSETFIQNDNDTRGMISNIIGGIFTQYAFLLLQSIIMYCIQSIRSGIIFGVFIYIILTIYRFKIMNKITKNEVELILILNRQLNPIIVYMNTYLDCTRLLICVIELINFIGCLLPAILIYQIRQYNYQWPLIWLLSKMVPFFLLFTIIPISIDGKFKKLFLMRFILALIIYIFLFGITTGLLLNIEVNILAIEWEFPTVLTLFITTITMNIILITLDSVFLIVDVNDVLTSDVQMNKYEIIMIMLGTKLENVAMFIIKFIFLIPFIAIYYVTFYFPLQYCWPNHRRNTTSIPHCCIRVKGKLLRDVA